MKKIKNNKLAIVIGSLAVVTLIGIVYAVFTQTLTINGTADVRDSKWDIHIVEEGQLEPSNTLSTSAKVLTKPTASSTSISNFALSLTTPGDTIEYTFHVVNDGDYDAEISTLTKNGPICTANGFTSDESAVKVCNKLIYTLKYDGGADVAEDDTILSKETKTMKLTIRYQEFDDETLLPTSNVSITGLGITIVYRQKGTAKVNANGTTLKKYVYSIGDEITFNNETYYVIAESPRNQDYVTVLKANPLTSSEINANKIGSDGINHVNRYTSSYVGEAYSYNGYGGLAYYSSPTCGYATPGGSYSSSGRASENATNYDTSDIKYVVDNWAITKFTNGELKTVDGYGARLITKDKLVNNLECTLSNCSSSRYDWTYRTYNGKYWYWTMTPSSVSFQAVYFVCDDYGNIVAYNTLYNYKGAVRPVINVYKSKL